MPVTYLEADKGIVMIWIVAVAVVVLLVVVTLVGARQEAAYRIRTGTVRKPRRHPAEGYLPPPPPAA